MMFPKTIATFSSLFKGMISFLFFLIIYISPARATHIVGGELYYQYIGGNNYKITLIVYRDCYNGVPDFDNPGWVSIFYNNAGFSPVDTLMIPILSKDTLKNVITSPCLLPPINVCYQIGIYIDTVILPPSSNGYLLVYQRCCRNHTIQNIVAPNQTGSTYTATIPGTVFFSKNSNPVFKNLPPTFICQNVPFTFDNSAFDVDTNVAGQPIDSFVYSLCNPLDYDGFFNGPPQPTPPIGPPYLTVNWLAPYSLNNLLGGVPMAIDSKTGLLTCTPSDTGQFVFGVCVEEYRNGIYLSTTKRDYQINVVDCPNITVAALQTPTLNCTNTSVSFSNQSVNASTYHWNFGDPTVTNDTSNLFAPTYVYPDSGKYTVVLVAYSGLNPACNDSTFGTISVYPGYKIAFEANKIPCSPVVSFNDSIFSGIYFTTGWHWDFGDGTTANVADPVHAFPGPGIYQVTFSGTSNKGCVDSMSMLVDLNYLKANISNSIPENCFNDCNGSAAVTTQFSIPPLTYLWSDSQNQTTDTAINLCIGNYFVIVTDSIGCKDTAFVTITQPAPLLLSIQSNTDYCNFACIGSAQTIATGGNSGYTYLWSDPQQQTTSTAGNLCNGLYTITVTDSKGCINTDTVTVEYIDSLPNVAATTDEDTLYVGQSTTLHATPSNTYIYNWSPASSLSSSINPDPVSTPLQTTNYVIQITDSNGCKVNDTVTVWVRNILCKEPEIFIPNSFTPNNDLANDVLLVRGNTMKELYFAIYDRWGEKVFETEDQKKGWDGNYNGVKSAPGVFVYYIKAVCFDNSEFNSKGNITLIR